MDGKTVGARTDEGDHLAQGRERLRQRDDRDHVAVLDPGRHAPAAGAEAERHPALEHRLHEGEQAGPGERQLGSAVAVGQGDAGRGLQPRLQLTSCA